MLQTGARVYVFSTKQIPRGNFFCAFIASRRRRIRRDDATPKLLCLARNDDYDDETGLDPLKNRHQRFVASPPPPARCQAEQHLSEKLQHGLERPASSSNLMMLWHFLCFSPFFLAHWSTQKSVRRRCNRVSERAVQTSPTSPPFSFGSSECAADKLVA